MSGSGIAPESEYPEIPHRRVVVERFGGTGRRGIPSRTPPGHRALERREARGKLVLVTS